jgi:hypothetical protein
MIKHTLAFTALAVALTASGSAQDITAEPNSDSVYLEAGFTPDPTTVNVTSGGTIDVSNVIDGCSGYISNAPDVRLTFSANSSADAYPLYIYAKASGDTTLVINAPDGNWYCNDDGSEGTNPLVVFGPAMSGDYEIWIGSYDQGEYHDATLEISELSGS